MAYAPIVDDPEGAADFRFGGVAAVASGGMEGVADFVDVGAVNADRLVEHLAGDVELLGPVGDVGGDLGVDLFGIAGTLGGVNMGGVRLVGFGCVVVLGHAGVPLSSWFWLVG